jgi:hypothetical protein
MSQSYLRLRFQNDGDGTGKLVARAQAGTFGGEGAAFFNIEQIEEFAAAIAGYPLPPDARLSISSGFAMDDNVGKVDQEHLGIEVYPIDTRGHVGVQVRMATPLWKGMRPQSQRKVSLEIVTAYQELSDFSHDMIAVVRGATEEALLRGEAEALAM